MTGANCTDLGNAYRLKELVKPDMRYCKPWNAWMWYDGRRWVERSEEMTNRVRDCLELIKVEAETIKSDRESDKLLKWYITSQSASHIKDMVKLLTHEEDIQIAPDAFDRDPFLLNVVNGTINLQTGQLQPHNQDDYITKMITVPYHESHSKVWEDFLHEITAGNADLVDFLQKVAGYSITGSTKAQVMFVLYGSGANGKSTLVEALRGLLGDYSKATDPSTFTVLSSGKVRNDIARLKGARFVTAVEMNRKGSELDSAMIKQMTGGDRITARYLYKESFEFFPTWKCWLSTNHLPDLQAIDHGIWRRIKIIPFKADFTAKADKDMLDKLNACQETILYWAVQGCLKWQAEGLGSMASVDESTLDYFEDQDPLFDFFQDTCYFHKDAVVSVAILYDRYLQWCTEHGERTFYKTTFGSMVKSRRGITPDRKNRVRFWRGVDLKHKTALKNLTEEEYDDPET